MTDLDRLIEAVDAGKVGWYDFPELCEAVWGDGDDRPNYMGTVRDAYNGSIDAAKRLHDALLGPDWSVSIALGAAFWHVDVTHYPYRDEDRRPDWNVTAGPEQGPARAWLLAILRAVKAKGDTPEGNAPAFSFTEAWSNPSEGPMVSSAEVARKLYGEGDTP